MVKQEKESKNYSPTPVMAEGASGPFVRQPQMGAFRETFAVAGGLLAILLLLWVTHPVLVISEEKYLFFHLILEFISILVSLLIFGIGWNAYSQERNGNITILAVSFLAVGLLDMAHALSYPGMPFLTTAIDPQKTLYFWLFARLIGGCALFYVACRPWNPFRIAKIRYVWLLLSLLCTAFVFWLILFHAALLPATFASGQGQTGFKLFVEYMIAAVNLATAVVLWLRSRQPLPFEISHFLAAVVLMAFSEICFTLYADITDVFNLLGHVYKIIADLFLYRAIFVESVREPFERMRQSEKILRENEEWLATTLNSIGDAVIATDVQERVIFMNPVAEALTGWPIKEASGKKIQEVFQIVHEDTRVPKENPVRRVIQEGRVINTDDRTILLCRDGRGVPISDSAAPIQGKNGPMIGVVLVFHDISERKRMEEQIYFQAYHDVLTGLPNRAYFSERLQEALREAQGKQKGLAVLFIDLDRFKLINDTLGHRMGDLAVQAVAERLLSCIKEGETLARLGGDEFVLLVPQLENEEEAAQLAERIRKSFATPFILGGKEYFLAVSIGISLYPRDGEDWETLVKKADIAMYRAKQFSNTYQFFDPQVNVVNSERLMIENGLRKAMDNDELVLYYQPQIELLRGEIVGVEALLRWKHPELGMVSPDTFVPIAEEMGMIIPLSRWILRQACKECMRWRSLGIPSVRVAVNLSMDQFRENQFILTVKEILEETGASPEDLELELTESMVMLHPEVTIDTLRRLKEMGIRISLDDFGTGYSSLSYLKRLPLHTLKLDRSFISHMANDEDSRAITKAVIQLAHTLKLQVLAEGVETVEQLRLLRSYRCDMIQGYVFSPPVPADVCRNLLLQQKARKPFIESALNL